LSEKSEAIYSNCLADLSFAGFDKPVFVSSYAVGNMTGTSDTISHVSRQTKNGIKEQEISGSCLALFVTTGMDNFKKLRKNEWRTYVLDCYFVILDYKNGTCYKKPTDFILPDFLYKWPDLHVVDLTGDGAQELIVTHYSKSIDFGVYHANADTHKITEIYSSYKDWENNNGDFMDRLAFEGELQDDYKVALKFPCIGYSKTVSVITDGGYRKSELHKKMDDWGCINYIGMWNKNGKLRKKWSKKHGDVFLYTLDDISCVKTEDGITQIELVRSICIGHRSENIGDMHIYLEYDNVSDALVIKNAEYVAALTAYKDWHKKTYGKLTFR